MPSQPRSLQYINNPFNLCVTINGNQFLAKELEIGNEKMIIFMYTIRALVGGEDNARIFSLVYTLMINKTEEIYRQLFQELVDLGEEARQILSPSMIITDFEQKIQAIGLATEYGNNENFSLKMRYITALAFLSPSEIPTAFNQIKPLLPLNAEEVIQYFEENYIHERVQRQHRNGTTL
uniref:MULE transposase domain-containing protein n=1 Tax=Rhizophagus irregularis (strain DAOM 181602 / DAOM 197198 / MUCL 43194) TaxID=747089 RepID=U9UD17_RHIID